MSNPSRITRITQIRPGLPVDPRHIVALYPRTKPDVKHVYDLIRAKTAEARAIADCAESDGYWFEESRTPSTVRQAIWDAARREIGGGDGSFTETERQAILTDPKRHGRRIGGRDVD